jgi:hypothetical protein
MGRQRPRAVVGRIVRGVELVKAALTFKFQTEYARMGTYFVMIILAIFWMVLLTADSTADVSAGIETWIVGACLLLVVIGQRQSRIITNGARVLRQQRTPQQLWRAWFVTSMTSTMYLWATLVLAGTALLLIAQSSWQWTSAAALLSVTLTLSTVTALSNAGVLRRAWAWIITVGGMVLLLLVTMTIGFIEGLNRLTQASFFLQVLLTLTWPLLAYFLAKSWQKESPLARASQGEKFIGVGTHIANYARRYTALRHGVQNRSVDGTVQNSQRTNIFLNASLVQGVMFPMVVLQFLASPSSGDVHPYHLFVLGISPLYFAMGLICKDLHWRQCLAPGGLHLGRLGWPIFLSTVALQIVGLLFWAFIWIVLSRAAFKVSLPHTLELAWNYRVFPLELIFATSLASVLRAAGAGSFRSNFVVFGTYSVTLILLGGLTLWTFGLSKGPALFAVDRYFLGCLLLATAALVLLSNRLWTVKKLQPFLRLN